MLQTQAIESSSVVQKSFAVIVRDESTRVRATVQADGQVNFGSQRIVGGPASVIAALANNGIEVTGKALRMALSSGVFQAITITKDGKPAAFGHVGATLTTQALTSLTQSAMQLNCEVAPAGKSGVALFVAAKSGTIIGLRADGTRCPADRLMAPLLNNGGFYPYYEVTGSGGTAMVPLCFAEELRDEAGARHAFGLPVPMPYLEQAIERAQYGEYLAAHGTAIFEEDVGLAALKMGGKLNLGAF